MQLIRKDASLMFLIVLLTSVYYWKQIDWGHYFLLFWVIDFFGYWPGVIYAKATSNPKPPQIFYSLYNIFHSNSGVFVIAFTYLYFFAGTAASMLALLLHLCVDRGLLGNFLKTREADAGFI